MSGILEKARQHYTEKLNQPMGCVEVPEWGGEKIYFKKAESLATQKKIASKISANGGTAEDGMVQALIERARNAEGKKLFTQSNFTELMTMTDKEVIARILDEMTKQSQSTTLEEAEKN